MDFKHGGLKRESYDDDFGDIIPRESISASRVHRQLKAYESAVGSRSNASNSESFRFSNMTGNMTEDTHLRNSRSMGLNNTADSPGFFTNMTPSQTPNMTPMKTPARKIDKTVLDPFMGQDTSAHQQNDTIRIFGFPLNKSHQVVAVFEKLGEIEARMEGNGNWVDIKYTSPAATREALEYNGHEITTGVMIGVKKVENHPLSGINASLALRTGAGEHIRAREPKPLHPSFENVSLFSTDWGFGRATSLSSAKYPVPQSFCDKVKEYILQW
eukprot:CAMPEP_0184495204 /NCGR_PEP_ID=MMETSP0113_2-20130426/30648_1 /TAXON_ID=91329 /ORGANISM="Norrisiella sphaerica, Strain BC52" /LENGTH=270 /DNA_ID=CAMNT_0026881283 /DNA_START=129 /DNA_END=941 /DNA_ORIENTATION=+